MSTPPRSRRTRSSATSTRRQKHTPSTSTPLSPARTRGGSRRAAVAAVPKKAGRAPTKSRARHARSSSMTVPNSGSKKNTMAAAATSSQAQQHAHMPARDSKCESDGFLYSTAPRGSLRAQVHSLAEQELFDSAALLCQFMIADTEQQPRSKTEVIEQLSLYGDILQATREHRRAIAQYQRVLRLLFAGLHDTENKSNHAAGADGSDTDELSTPRSKAKNVSTTPGSSPAKRKRLNRAERTTPLLTPVTNTSESISLDIGRSHANSVTIEAADDDRSRQQRIDNAADIDDFDLSSPKRRKQRKKFVCKRSLTDVTDTPELPQSSPALHMSGGSSTPAATSALMSGFESSSQTWYDEPDSKLETPWLVSMSVRTRVQMYKCATEADDWDLARSALESIPRAHRTARVHYFLAQIYERHDQTRFAIAAYKHAFEANPMIVDAGIALLKLCVPLSEVQNLLKCPGRHVQRKQPPPDWIETMLKAHALKNVHKYAPALKHFDEVTERFPDTSHILCQKGSIHLLLAHPLASRQLFERQHKLDPYNLDHIDMLAWILRTRGFSSELNRITHEALEVNADRPEAWVCAALYADECGRHEQASKYIDKAVDLNPRHMPAYLVKGYILLSTGRQQQAIDAYRKAYHLDKREMSAFQGMVEAHISKKELREANRLAKEALTLLPRNAKAITLHGRVLSEHERTRRDGLAFLNKALEIDPDCVDAIMGIVKHHIRWEQYDQAIVALSKFMQTHNEDYLHCKLATVYMFQGDVQSAVRSFRSALEISPFYPPARQGLEKITSSMPDTQTHVLPDVDIGDLQRVGARRRLPVVDADLDAPSFSLSRQRMDETQQTQLVFEPQEVDVWNEEEEQDVDVEELEEDEEANSEEEDDESEEEDSGSEPDTDDSRDIGSLL
jgi:tetratricopeptide (TPR) repeat protein